MRWWPASPSLRRRSRRRTAVSTDEAAAPAPLLPADMGRGAPEMQARLEEARSRLKRSIEPRGEDE